MVRVIFLDFDGVLNSEDWAHHHPSGGGFCALHEEKPFDPSAVAVLNTIVGKSNAKIVISSTWRQVYDIKGLRKILTENGIYADVIDVTPHIGRNDPEMGEWYDQPQGSRAVERGDEIKAWLAAHPDTKAFVILDDDDDMGLVRDHLVQTNWRHGLRQEHVAPALILLECP